MVLLVLLVPIVEWAVSRGMRACSSLHKFDNLAHLF